MLTILSNARVFAPEDLGIKNLLLGGGRILAVSDDQLEATGAVIIDCEGRTLIPGFIDGHAHITGGGGENGFSTRVPAPLLSQYTSAGVSTVVGVLGTDDTTRDTRSVVAQVYALREQGLGVYCHTGGYHVPPATLTGSVRDDIVFIEPVIGVGELAISDHRSSQPGLEELLRIASDAHVAGLITGKAGIVHLHLGDGERGLDLVRRGLEGSELPARVFNPTHVNRQSALLEEATALAKRGCYVDATAFPVDENDPAVDAADALIQFIDAGGPLEKFTISSDGGGCLPVFDDTGRMTQMGIGLADELPRTFKSLLDQGMPLAEALSVFTSNPAELLRFNDRGRISLGMRADLVLLTEDHAIRDVIVGGQWHVRDGQPVIRGQFEPANASPSESS